MKRLTMLMASVACVRPVGAGAASTSAAGTWTSTAVTKTNATLAFAAWQLNDAYNTQIAVGGNDQMFLGAGGTNQPGQGAFFANGVLLSVFQHFCDTATDEDVFRDLSGFPTVGANVAK